MADWIETEGTIASVDVVEGIDGDRTYSVVFTYKVDGHFYGGTFTAFESKHEAGDSVVVKYDPGHPGRNNWLRQESFLRLFYVIFFLLLGVIAIYYLNHR